MLPRMSRNKLMRYNHNFTDCIPFCCLMHHNFPCRLIFYPIHQGSSTRFPYLWSLNPVFTSTQVMSADLQNEGRSSRSCLSCQIWEYLTANAMKAVSNVVHGNSWQLLIFSLLVRCIPTCLTLGLKLPTYFVQFDSMAMETYKRPIDKPRTILRSCPAMSSQEISMYRTGARSCWLWS